MHPFKSSKTVVQGLLFPVRLPLCSIDYLCGFFCVCVCVIYLHLTSKTWNCRKRFAESNIWDRTAWSISLRLIIPGVEASLRGMVTLSVPLQNCTVGKQWNFHHLLANQQIYWEGKGAATGVSEFMGSHSQPIFCCGTVGKRAQYLSKKRL